MNESPSEKALEASRRWVAEAEEEVFGGQLFPFPLKEALCDSRPTSPEGEFFLAMERLDQAAYPTIEPLL